LHIAKKPQNAEVHAMASTPTLKENQLLEETILFSGVWRGRAIV
jgi:hypothetical protein